jgi:hypothetical protein
MGDWAPDKGDLAHAREPDIADVLPTAVEETVILLAAKPGPDAGFVQSVYCHGFSDAAHNNTCHGAQ